MPIVSLFRPATRSLRLAFALLTTAITSIFAQTSTPSAADGFDPNVDGNVYSLVTQPDGKVIIAGQFATVRPNGTSGAARNNVARLNSDGSLDLAFDPNTNGPIYAMQLLSNGKILIGGDFTSVQPNRAATPTPINRLARLNADGTLDATFNPNVGGGFTPQVRALLIQPNGQIVLGGGFTTVGTATRNRIARLNADGTLDTGFNPNADNVVYALANHVNGKILMAGGFTFLQANGVGDPVPRNRIARLNTDGTPDSEFNPNLDNRALSLAVQRDGKILVGGDFAYVQPLGYATAVACNRFARINVDGSLDTTVNMNATGSVAAIGVMPDGGILIGGAFSGVWAAGSQVTGRPYLARFTPNGTVDLTFASGVNQLVAAFALLADGQLVIGGDFTGLQPIGSPGTVVRNHVARLNQDGSLDATFNLDEGGRPLVEIVQKDGKIVIGGSFRSVGGATHDRLARLNPDGTLDTTFNPDLNGEVFTMVLQPADQKILIGGTFTTIGGEPRNFIARLNPSGTIDSQFNPNCNAQVGVIALQPDGKILVGGSFTTVQPLGATAAKTVNYFMRLNADGTLDTKFLPNPNSAVDALALQADGKIVIGGTFTTVEPGVDLTPVVTTNADGTTTTTIPSGTTAAINYLGRINADGTFDNTFLPAPNGNISAITLQTDGKILVGGNFSGLRPNGALLTTTRNRIFRLNPDGTADTTFDPNANSSVVAITVQPNGQILVGGLFTTFTPNGATNFTLRKYAARLNADGTVDPAFNLDLNELYGNRVDSYCVQADGRVLIGGTFTSMQPVGAPSRVPSVHFARLNTGGTLDTTFLPGVGGQAGGQINTMALQADGKVVVGGSFSDLGGASTPNLSRFTPAGALDTSFAPSIGPDGPINAVLVRPNSPTVVLQGTGIAWINTDGTVRATFSPGADSRITGTIDAIAVQPDGGVIVGGTFSTPTGIPGSNLVRFSPAGALDTNFGPSPNGAVDAIVVQADGKIVVGGSFTSIGGAARDYIARLNPDGTVDGSYDPSASARVNALALQPDGRILVGGTFLSFTPNATTATTTTTTTTTPNAGNSTNSVTNANGSVTTTTVSTVSGVTTTTVTTVSETATARYYIARLNTDATLDTTFNPYANGAVNALLLRPDGKIVIGGAFTSLQPNATGTAIGRNRVALLNADGTVDGTYDPNANGDVYALAFNPDGKVILGGAFTSFAPNGGGSFTRNHIARLNTDATMDTNFDPNTNSSVTAIKVQANAQILIGGVFDTLSPNGATVATTRNNIARINFDGTVDNGFDPNADGAVNAITLAADGSLLIGGAFTTLSLTPPLLVGGAFNSLSGVPSRNLALVADDGSVNGNFQPNPNGAVNALLVQADGKFVVGGAFTSIAAVTRNRLARFNADNTLDTAFNPNFGGTVNAVVRQADGKLVVGGAFTTVGGAPRSSLARLNSDGSLDTSFSQPAGLTGLAVRALAVQGDGRILVLSDGSGVRSILARVNADGSADSSFASVNAGSAAIDTFALQTDGHILIGGEFTTLLGAQIARVARLNSNGSLDPTYNPGPDGSVTALAVQPDGRLLLGGSFSTIGGLARGGVARLAAVTAATQTLSATSTTLLWVRGGANPELSSVTFEQSTDGEQTWTLLGQAGRVSGTANWQLNGLSLPASGLFYVRARGVMPAAAGTSSGLLESLAEFNLAATPGVGPFSGAALTLDVGGALIDSATGIVTMQTTSTGTASAAMTSAPIGLVTQAVAATSALSTPPGLLVNLSTRARVATATPLIAGFTVGGTGSRNVLLRAVGPSLGAFGVAAPLATPRLQLYDGGGRLLADNSSWTAPTSGMAAIAAATASTGAFPLAANNGADAAAVMTLSPGAYSMQVLNNGASAGGVALAEVYDAGTGPGAQLTNLSTRGNVGLGDAAFVGGLVIGGGPVRLLVRGIGPALASKFGVAGALADPVLGVYAANGQLLASNDNWGQGASGGLVSASAADVIAAEASVGAFALDVGSKDAALVLTLVPGAYTVQITGVGGTTGAALIEVYQLP